MTSPWTSDQAATAALSRVLTIIFPTVITLWLVDVNALILRRAPSLEA